MTPDEAFIIARTGVAAQVAGHVASIGIAMRGDNELIYRTTQMMMNHGGSFVKLLAHLYALADGDNQVRLLNAFTEYFVQYIAMMDLSEDDLRSLSGRRE